MGVLGKHRNTPKDMSHHSLTSWCPSATMGNPEKHPGLGVQTHPSQTPELPENRRGVRAWVGLHGLFQPSHSMNP